MYAQITITKLTEHGGFGPLTEHWGFYDYYSDWLEFIIIGSIILEILLDVPQPINHNYPYGPKSHPLTPMLF